MPGPLWQACNTTPLLSSRHFPFWPLWLENSHRSISSWDVETDTPPLPPPQLKRCWQESHLYGGKWRQPRRAAVLCERAKQRGLPRRRLTNWSERRALQLSGEVESTPANYCKLWRLRCVEPVSFFTVTTSWGHAISELAILSIPNMPVWGKSISFPYVTLIHNQTKQKHKNDSTLCGWLPCGAHVSLYTANTSKAKELLCLVGPFWRLLLLSHQTPKTF